jgi:hypothetical protein
MFRYCPSLTQVYVSCYFSSFSLDLWIPRHHLYSLSPSFPFIAALCQWFKPVYAVWNALNMRPFLDCTKPADSSRPHVVHTIPNRKNSRCTGSVNNTLRRLLHKSSPRSINLVLDFSVRALTPSWTSVSRLEFNLHSPILYIHLHVSQFFHFYVFCLFLPNTAFSRTFLLHNISQLAISVSLMLPFRLLYRPPYDCSLPLQSVLAACNFFFYLLNSARALNF